MKRSIWIDIITNILDILFGVVTSWINPAIVPFYLFSILFVVLEAFPSEYIHGPAVTVIIKTAPVWYLIYYIQVFKPYGDTRNGKNKYDPAKENSYKQFFTVGLILSSMGDSFMIFPSTFIPGVFVYGLAHVMYIGGMTNRHLRWGRLALLVYPYNAIGLIPLLLWIKSFVLSGIVIVYTIMLTTVLYLGLANFETGRNSITLLAAIGSFLFYTSDYLIAVDRWVINLPFRNLLVLSTYYLAQFNLALSV